MVSNYPKFFFGTVVCLSFVYLLYLPVLQQSTVIGRPVDVKGWEDKKSRNTSLYVRPYEKTTLMVGSKVCLSGPLFLLVVVCSRLDNFSMRAAIRETWGSELPPNTSIIFFTGKTSNDTLQKYLEEENSINGDLVQEDFYDSYNNLTIKSVMMLKYIHQDCGHAQNIVKTDDDIYFDVKKFYTIIQDPKFQSKKYSLLGCLIKYGKPIRSAAKKWYTPEYMFNEDVYPHYLAGVAYMMTRTVAEILYYVSLRTPLLHHEDVFITGICAKAAGITPRNMPGIHNGKVEFDVCNSLYIVAHRYNPERLRRLWTPFTNGRCNSSAASIPSSSFIHRLKNIMS